MEEHVACTQQNRNACPILVRKKLKVSMDEGMLLI
jgi:hypothetical protein